MKFEMNIGKKHFYALVALIVIATTVFAGALVFAAPPLDSQSHDGAEIWVDTDGVDGVDTQLITNGMITDGIAGAGGGGAVDVNGDGLPDSMDVNPEDSVIDANFVDLSGVEVDFPPPPESVQHAQCATIATNVEHVSWTQVEGKPQLPGDLLCVNEVNAVYDYSGAATVTCPTGFTSTGGGCNVGGGTAVIHGFPYVDATDSGWACCRPKSGTGSSDLTNCEDVGNGLKAHARCCAITGAYCGDNNIDDSRALMGVNLYEECDSGTANSDTTPNACRTDCQIPVCGDGYTDTQKGDIYNDNSIYPDVTTTQSNEGCDDGNRISGDGCSGSCYDEYLVFVTGMRYDGDLVGAANENNFGYTYGGLGRDFNINEGHLAADALCMHEAYNAILNGYISGDFNGREFKAMVATINEPNALDRLDSFFGIGRYAEDRCWRNMGTDVIWAGTPACSNNPQTLLGWRYSIDGGNNLDNPITRDAYGNTYTTTSYYWTGMDDVGTGLATHNCNGWSSNAAGLEGSRGRVGVTGESFWQVDGGALSCDKQSRLLCFQVGTETIADNLGPNGY
ncbi:hypothetical protein ACFL6I_07955 [candidate division KSB1 bacterium]